MEDDDWQRRKARIVREAQTRAFRGQGSAEEVALNQRLYEDWIAAGRPGDFLTFAHEARGCPLKPNSQRRVDR